MERNMICGIFAAAAVAVLVLTSCVKDTLYNTPHPDTGTVALTADFTQRGQSAGIPAEYSVRHVCCGTEEHCTMPQSGENILPWNLTPGTHKLHAWTSCAGTEVKDGTVMVEETSSGMVTSMPGYLFAGAVDVEAVRDDTVHVALPMFQRTRDLQFSLAVTEGDPELISSVSGTLSGIAGSFSLAQLQVTGDPVGTSILFVRKGASLTAAARLLGVMGQSQTLTLEIRFTDRADVHRIDVDLTDAMSGFNVDMTTARVVMGNVETPVGMDAAANITGWKDVEGESEDAVM